MSNDCIGWFCSFETYLERSCKSVEWAWRFLLGVSGIILCNVNARKFGIWTLYSEIALCNMHLCLLFTIFVFCFIWLGLQVRTWGEVVGGLQARCYCKWAKSFETGFNSPNNACNCSVFVAKCFVPLINLDSQIMLCTFCLVVKSSLLI
jgi:hypothetical protein